MMAPRRALGQFDERPGKRRVKYAAKILVDFSPALPKLHTVTLTGALEVATTNLAEGRTAKLRIVGDGTARALTFPAGWVFVGRPTPTSLAINAEALLVVHSCGSTDADVLVEYFASDDVAASTPGGTTTSVQYNDASAFGGDSFLRWNKTDKRLGVGVGTPLVHVDVDGAIAMRPSAPSTYVDQSLIADNTTITVGDRGFVRLYPDSGYAQNHTILLPDGLVNGQILVLYCNGPSLQLFDAVNVLLDRPWVPGVTGSTLTLIWDGGAAVGGDGWVELGRTTKNRIRSVTLNTAGPTLDVQNGNAFIKLTLGASSSGNIVLAPTGDPNVTPQDMDEVTIFCVSNAGTAQIPDATASNVLLSAAWNPTADDTLTLIYVEAQNLWAEKCRSTN